VTKGLSWFFFVLNVKFAALWVSTCLKMSKSNTQGKLVWSD